jgi:hypothetical protein
VLVCEEHHWGERDRAIALADITTAEDGVVHLRLRKRDVIALPTAKVRC